MAKTIEYQRSSEKQIQYGVRFVLSYYTLRRSLWSGAVIDARVPGGSHFVLLLLHFMQANLSGSWLCLPTVTPGPSPDAWLWIHPRDSSLLYTSQ